MMKLLTDLLMKCHENGLNFDIAHIENALVVSICKLKFDDGEAEITNVTRGYTKGWKMDYTTPEKELERMHKEVDEFLARGTPGELDSYLIDNDLKTEKARAKLTEQERAMRDAGHKLSDFM